jgi:hypothetical protein
MLKRSYYAFIPVISPIIFGILTCLFFASVGLLHDIFSIIIYFSLLFGICLFITEFSSTLNRALIILYVENSIIGFFIICIEPRRLVMFDKMFKELGKPLPEIMQTSVKICQFLTNSDLLNILVFMVYVGILIGSHYFLNSIQRKFIFQCSLQAVLILILIIYTYAIQHYICIIIYIIYSNSWSWKFSLIA